MRYAAFKENSGTIVATVMCEGIDGLWFGSEILSIPSSSEPALIGRLVQSALERSKEGLEPPSSNDRKKLERTTYKVLGVKNAADFAIAGRSVLLMEEQDNVLPFQPLRYLGARKGWFANQNDDPPIVVTNGTEEEVGVALMEAFAHFDDGAGGG